MMKTVKGDSDFSPPHTSFSSSNTPNIFDSMAFGRRKNCLSHNWRIIRSALKLSDTIPASQHCQVRQTFAMACSITMTILKAHRSFQHLKEKQIFCHLLWLIVIHTLNLGGSTFTGMGTAESFARCHHVHLELEDNLHTFQIKAVSNDYSSERHLGLLPQPYRPWSSHPCLSTLELSNTQSLCPPWSSPIVIVSTLKLSNSPCVHIEAL